jgi:putative mRNA 3-end processing factor
MYTPDDLLVLTSSGLYCPEADFYIDPWRPVKQALITHAHADHARRGSVHYLAHEHSASVLKLRLGADIQLQTITYGVPIQHRGIRITFFPAGHIPGSAQIRIEGKGQTWVVSGDYKVKADGLTPAFEPVACSHFISECTFGLPAFQFPPQNLVFEDILQWWNTNRNAGKNSVLFAYSLGKAQRLIHHLQQEDGPLWVHPSIFHVQEALLADGFPVRPVVSTADLPKKLPAGAMVVAPPAVMDSTWLKRFQPLETAYVSGWMHIRGIRRRTSADRGFVLSDHADWNELQTAVKATGAEKIYFTHGYTEECAQWYSELGLDASVLSTPFSGDSAASEISEETTS